MTIWQTITLLAFVAALANLMFTLLWRRPLDRPVVVVDVILVLGTYVVAGAA